MDPEGDAPIPETIAGRPTVKSLGGVVMSGTLWLSGARVVRIVMIIVTLAILARLITPAQFGVAAAAGLAETFVLAIMDHWLGIALLRPKELPRRSIQNQLWASLTVALVLAGLTIAAAPLLERALGFPQLAAAMIALTPIYFAYAFIAASTALLHRRYRFRAVAIVTLLCRLFGYSLPAIAMALMGLGMWAIVWAQLISVSLTAAVLVVMARLPLGWPKDFGLRTLDFSGVRGGLYGVISSVQANIDTLAVAVVLGPAVTGLYSRAYNISVQAKDPFVSLQMTVRQALAAIQDEPQRAQEGLIRVLRLAGIGGFIVAAFAFSAAHPLTGVLLGPRWMAAAPILAIFFLGFPARVALLMLDAASMALGQVWPLVARQFALLVVIGATAFAVAFEGAAWVAAAVTAALWLGLLTSAVLVSRGARIPLWRILAALLPGLAIGLVLAVVLLIALWHMPADPFVRTAGAAAICGLACAVVGLLLPQTWLGGFMGAARQAVLRRAGFAR